MANCLISFGICGCNLPQKYIVTVSAFYNNLATNDDNDEDDGDDNDVVKEEVKWLWVGWWLHTLCECGNTIDKQGGQYVNGIHC